MIGKTIAHYKILEKLGEGGMGEVYLAEDKKLKRKVAIKLLPPHLTKDKEARERFEREAQAAAALNHPNIVTIHEIGEHDDQVFIVMEYVDGKTLREKMDEGGLNGYSPLPIDEIIKIAIQICEGLERAHQAEIVHRDIKPGNIIINKDNRLKILDFGLAKLRGVNQLTKETSTIGTIHYMSPEQARGEIVDHRTDIWSLGVVLYNMLTGQLPFKGDYEQAIMYSILNEEPEPITDLRASIPKKLERIVAKAMAKNPTERYHHLEKMLIDISKLRKKHDSVNTATRPTELKLLHKKQIHLIKSQKVMERSISQRLSKSSLGAFVGRKLELELILRAFSSPELPFVVAYIHGQGGIGKSCLLQNLISRITSNVGRIIFIDCRDIEPTITGFLDRFCSELGIENEEHAFNEVFSHLYKIRDRMLLCLDQYENFILLDTWLRQSFVPALPDTFLTVIASRYAPKTSWLTTPGWQDLFREIELRELSDEESTQMLETRCLNIDQIKKVKRFSHGHPLTLELGAAALRSQPDLKVHEGPPAKIVSQLSRALLSDLSRDMLEAVEAVSTVRWITEPILRTLLGVPEARNIFDSLGELPFVYSTLEGLILHDVVHEAVSKDLSSRDPERYCLYRSRAWHFLSKESQKAQEHHLWHLTGDMLFLIENPVIREAFFPKGSSDYVVQSASKDDYDDIEKIARSEESPEAALQIERWLKHCPESFSVAVGPDRKVVGFYFCFEPYKVDSKWLSSDPLTFAWLKHLKQNPVKPEERVLFLRRWLARKTGDDFSPIQGACWIDIKRTYMEMRPHLRRLYTTVNDLEAYAPVVIPLGFKPIDNAHVELGGRTYYSAVLDFGEGSVDGWLKGLVKAELGADPSDV